MALHVRALGADLLKELQSKAAVDETQQLFAALQAQYASLDGRHRALEAQMEGSAVAAESLFSEAEAASMQARAQLQGHACMHACMQRT